MTRDAESSEESLHTSEYKFSIEELDRQEEETPPFPELVVGAWKEALAADGHERFALVSLMLLLTVVPAVLFLLMVLSWVGVI